MQWQSTEPTHFISVTDTLTGPASKTKTQGACNTPITLKSLKAIAYFTSYSYLYTLYWSQTPAAKKIIPAKISDYSLLRHGTSNYYHLVFYVKVVNASALFGRHHSTQYNSNAPQYNHQHLNCIILKFTNKFWTLRFLWNSKHDAYLAWPVAL